MSLLLRKRNGSLFPSLVNDFMDTGTLFTPSIFDFDTNFPEMDSSLVIPDMNVIEGEKDFKFELAAPGLERKDFKVEMDNGMLTISAEKKEEKKEDTKNYRRREFSYNSFSRSFTLPENSVPDKIDAKYDNGILHLTLPKKEVTVSKPKKEIKVA